MRQVSQRLHQAEPKTLQCGSGEVTRWENVYHICRLKRKEYVQITPNSLTVKHYYGFCYYCSE